MAQQAAQTELDDDMNHLPEVREAGAPPHIAAIYEDIKSAAVLPQVNLIFRYFATKPGVLEWVWQALRPLYCSEELAAAAQKLTRSIERSGPSPLSAALTGHKLETAKTVLASYNSGNPQNLIALTALIRRLNADPANAPQPITLSPRKTSSQPPPHAFPPLPERAGLPPETMALVEKLAARHRRAPGVIPSMYLHLALWPSALKAADIYLQPVIEAPGWQPLVASVINEAGKTAEKLAPGIAFTTPAPDAETLAVVETTLTDFIQGTIPELITVGALLAID